MHLVASRDMLVNFSKMASDAGGWSINGAVKKDKFSSEQKLSRISWKKERLRWTW